MNFRFSHLNNSIMRWGYLAIISLWLVACGAQIKSDEGNQKGVIQSSEILAKNSEKNSEEKGGVFLNPQIWQTKEGLEVWFLADSSIPIVDFRLTFKAGSAQPASVQGLASVTNQLIGHGTAEIDENELSLRLDTYAINLSLSSHRDMAIISLRALSGENFNNGVDILVQTLAKTAFPDEGLQRVIANRKVSLERNKKLPDSLVSQGFWSNMYGEHPYSQQASGTLESLQKINRQTVREFYQRYYVAENGVLVIVGDITRQQAEQKANLISRSLPSSSTPLPLLSQAKSLASSMRKHIEVESNQMHIRIGQLALPRSHPDYIPLYVANQILGGGALNSVLGNVIREQQGWAYSVGSYMQPMLAGGPWLIYMQTANETSEAAIEKTLEVVSDFEPYLSDQRVQEAVQYLRGNFALNTDSNKEVLGYLSMMAFYDLPHNYLNVVDNRLAQVTPQQVREAWKKHFDKSKLLIVSAGKKLQAKK